MTNAIQPQDKCALLLGNGPSLAGLDLANDVSDMHTFGMNAAHRYWKNVDWWPTYYSCLDTVVGESHYEAIEDLILKSRRNGIQRFLLRENVCKRLPQECLNRVDVYEDLVAASLLPNLPDITTGSHTLLWAQHLGYQTILLAGVDLDYVEQVDHSELIDGVLEISGEGQNPNYFFDDYQLPGDRYNIPNPRPNMHIESWVNASRHLRFPTVVVNLNRASRLEIFVKNQADALLTRGPFKSNSYEGLAITVDSLNRRKYSTESIVKFAYDEVGFLASRDEWCRGLVGKDALVSSDSTGIHLWFDGKSQNFSLSKNEGDNASVKEAKVEIIFTTDAGLVLRVIEELRKRSIPTVGQLIQKKISRVAKSFYAIAVPNRIKKISLAENWRDISTYYFSFRGVLILILSAAFTFILSLPTNSIFTWLLVWVLLLVLLPLSQRR